MDKAIEDLKKACYELKEGRGDLIPALVDAARKGVTNGEMTVPMREVFGWVVME